ncbi:MAG: hypothetical protein MRY21_02785 [Simkaniaceae bacterium]|nr:hypothetical protein [Simkaniaceae bacterium]
MAKSGSNWLLLLALSLLLSACGGRVMTTDGYSEVAIGTPKEKLVEVYGRPASRRTIDDDQVVYEYYERITLGTNTVEIRHYFFVITDGKVSAKYVRRDDVPPYNQINDDQIYPYSGP